MDMDYVWTEVRYGRNKRLYLHKGSILPLGCIGAEGQSILR